MSPALVFANIDGLVGFEVGDLQTGLVLDRVQVNGYTPAQLATYECPSHGLAFTPDERALWVADGVDNRLRIFDATTYPPVEKSSIQLTRQPRSIAFSRDGRFAYASTGDVLDVATKRIVAALKDEQGKLVEMRAHDRGRNAVDCSSRDRPTMSVEQEGEGRNRHVRVPRLTSSWV